LQPCSRHYLSRLCARINSRLWTFRSSRTTWQLGLMSLGSAITFSVSEQIRPYGTIALALCNPRHLIANTHTGSGDKLKDAISKIVEQSLDNINDSIVKRTATESLARVAMQTPQHSTSNAPSYENTGYREPYTAGNGPIDPAVTSQSASYTTMAGGAAHPYSLGTSISVPQQTSNAFEHQQTYSSEDPGMRPTHAAALAAVSSNPSQPTNSYPYANSHAPSANSSQHVYPNNGYAAQDWRQWTRTYMQPQPIGQSGEYLNTATTLMALGRDGGSQDPGNNGPGPMDNPGHVHWPELAFPGAANGHGHMSQQ